VNEHGATILGWCSVRQGEEPFQKQRVGPRWQVIPLKMVPLEAAGDILPLAVLLGGRAVTRTVAAPTFPDYQGSWIIFFVLKPDPTRSVCSTWETLGATDANPGCSLASFATLPAASTFC
jgi:hypothetical protein